MNAFFTKQKKGKKKILYWWSFMAAWNKNADISTGSSTINMQRFKVLQFNSTETWTETLILWLWSLVRKVIE